MISPTGGWAMKRGLLLSIGILLALATGCTQAEPRPGSPSSSTPSSSASSDAPEPPESGPATPQGAAAITVNDAKLVQAYGSAAVFPAGEAVPATSEVAVLRRERPVGTGNVAWMPDANTYCLVSIREQTSHRQCFGLAAKRKPSGYVHVGNTLPQGLGDLAEPPQMQLTVSVVENTSGPFSYTGGTPEHATPVQEATVKFPSGRTMTFLTYEFPERESIPMDAEICNAGRVVCFKAFESTPYGE